MNKRSISISPKYLLTAAICLTFVSVILRTVNMLFFFDIGIGYYTQGAPLPIISNILLGIGVILFIPLSLLSFKKRDIIYGRSSPLEICSSCVAALCAAFLAVTSVISVVKGDRASILLAALSFMCVLYFICAITDVKPIFKILTGFAVIIRLTMMLGASYFNQSVMMNAPDKLLFGIACIFAMLFIVSELKVFTESVRSALYVFAAASAMTICATSSVPSIIAYHAGRLPEDNGLYSEYYLLFGIAVYAAIRLADTAIRSKTVSHNESEASPFSAEGDIDNQDKRTDCEEHL